LKIKMTASTASPRWDAFAGEVRVQALTEMD
jgi:hypothetical protein